MATEQEFESNLLPDGTGRFLDAPIMWSVEALLAVAHSGAKVLDKESVESAGGGVVGT